jgi:DNA-binding transcriptional LysR family regulator
LALLQNQCFLDWGESREAGWYQYAVRVHITQQHAEDSSYLYSRYVEIRQLEALIGIADHGSFSGAAEVLGTVQSNISNRIAHLETELGTELVNRSNGLLTESGEIVVDRARRILGELRGIASDVSELNAEIHGQVVLGMIGSAGRWIVPLLLEALKESYPHVALHIVEGTNSVIEPQLVKGQLDLAVLAWPIYAPELSGVDIFSEDLVLIVDKEHPLAQLPEPLTFATLAQYEILLPFRGTPIRREIDEASRLQGVELKPLIELDGLRTIASLTFDGYGPSILPATMLSRHLRDKFVARHIDKIAKRRVLLATRRFGFPAAPVRAIHALLIDVVRHATNVPDGVYLGKTPPQ